MKEIVTSIYKEYKFNLHKIKTEIIILPLSNI